MLNIVISGIYVAVFLIALGAIIMFIFHLGNMIANIKSEKRFSASLLSPLILLMPSMFTEKGNRHREKFAAYLLLALVMMGFLALLDNYLDKLP